MQIGKKRSVELNEFVNAKRFSVELNGKVNFFLRWIELCQLKSSHAINWCSQNGSKHPNWYDVKVACDATRIGKCSCTVNRVVAQVLCQLCAYQPHQYDDVFVLISPIK